MRDRLVARGKLTIAVAAARQPIVLPARAHLRRPGQFPVLASTRIWSANDGARQSSAFTTNCPLFFPILNARTDSILGAVMNAFATARRCFAALCLGAICTGSAIAQAQVLRVSAIPDEPPTE